MLNTNINGNVDIKDVQAAEEIINENKDYEFTAWSNWPDDIRGRLDSGEEEVEDILSDLEDEISALHSDIDDFYFRAEDLGVSDKMDYSVMTDAIEEYTSIYSEYDIEMSDNITQILESVNEMVA